MIGDFGSATVVTDFAPHTEPDNRLVLAGTNTDHVALHRGAVLRTKVTKKALGKGEVESSILSGSTSKSLKQMTYSASLPRYT